MSQPERSLYNPWSLQPENRVNNASTRCNIYPVNDRYRSFTDHSYNVKRTFLRNWATHQVQIFRASQGLSSASFSKIWVKNIHCFRSYSGKSPIFVNSDTHSEVLNIFIRNFTEFIKKWSLTITENFNFLAFMVYEK